MIMIIKRKWKETTTAKQQQQQIIDLIGFTL